MTMPARYEAPAIVERTRIDQPMIGTVASGGIHASAVFHPVTDYEAPAIVERTPVDLPLVAVASGGTFSAKFRTDAD